MDRQSELAIVRRAYAKQVLAAAGVVDARIEHAYAAIARESFLGPGPWSMFRLRTAHSKLELSIPTPDADPVYLYVDQPVALICDRGIFNGQPSLHALLLAAAKVKEGEHVVHVGAGTGYYSAIMANLVGANGKVTAIECDSLLAERARRCLSEYSNVTVVEGDGSTVSFDVADVIYVNAGVTHPTDTWLDALGEDGRLIIPLTTRENFPAPGSAFDPVKALRSGAYFRIQRRGATFDARGLLPTVIVPAHGKARDSVVEAVLASAFAKGDWQRVTHLVRAENAPDEHCWLKSRRWSLTYN